jgi:hypothetical protein
MEFDTFCNQLPPIIDDDDADVMGFKWPLFPEMIDEIDGDRIYDAHAGYKRKCSEMLNMFETETELPKCLGPLEFPKPPQTANVVIKLIQPVQKKKKEQLPPKVFTQSEHLLNVFRNEYTKWPNNKDKDVHINYKCMYDTLRFYNVMVTSCQKHDVEWEPMLMPIVMWTSSFSPNMKAFVDNHIHNFNMMSGKIMIQKNSPLYFLILSEISRWDIRVHKFKKFRISLFKAHLELNTSFRKMTQNQPFSVFSSGGAPQLSYICAKFSIPSNVRCEKQWTYIKIICAFLINEYFISGMFSPNNIRRVEYSRDWNRSLCLGMQQCVNKTRNGLLHRPLMINQNVSKSWLEIFSFQQKPNCFMLTFSSYDPHISLSELIETFSSIVKNTKTRLKNITGVKMEAFTNCERNIPNYTEILPIHMLHILKKLQAFMLLQKNPNDIRSVLLEHNYGNEFPLYFLF